MPPRRGRPRINPDHAMTSAERQRRYREIHGKPVEVWQVLYNLDRGYSGLKEEERPELRRSIKRLLLQWVKSEAEYKRWRNTEARRPTRRRR